MPGNPENHSVLTRTTAGSTRIQGWSSRGVASDGTVQLCNGMANVRTVRIRAVQLDTLTLRAFGKRERKVSFSDSRGLSGGSPDNWQRLRPSCRFVYGIDKGKGDAIMGWLLTTRSSTVLCSVRAVSNLATLLQSGS